MAAKLQVFLVHYIEFGGHHLGVGNAFGIGTTDEVLDVVRNFGLELLDHFVVFYVDDTGEGRYKGDLAHFRFIEMLVLDLDNTFLTQLVAVQVVSNKYFFFILFQP